MDNFRCLECGAIFEEPHGKKTTYESIYGGFTGTSTRCVIDVCPECHSEDIEEYMEEEDED